MSTDRSLEGCAGGAQIYGTDYRIAHSVLESIVRGVVAADAALQLHQGSPLGRDKAIDVEVTESSCRVTLALDARLGDHLPTAAAALQKRVADTLQDTTGLTVEAVDVTVVSVVPARGSA